MSGPLGFPLLWEQKITPEAFERMRADAPKCEACGQPKHFLGDCPAAVARHRKDALAEAVEMLRKLVKDHEAVITKTKKRDYEGGLQEESFQQGIEHAADMIEATNV